MTLLRSDFSATFIPTAADIRPELIQLNKLCRRSSVEVAKQVEEYVEAIWDILDATETSTAPDATVAATASLKQLYSDFVDFTRAERIKINRAIAIGAVDVTDAIAIQLKDFLVHRGWTFA
jgi:hypothetical protein